MKHAFVYDSSARLARCRDCDVSTAGDGESSPLLAAIHDDGDCPAPYRRHRLVSVSRGMQCLTCGAAWTADERREYPPEMAPPWATEPCPMLSPEGVA